MTMEKRHHPIRQYSGGGTRRSAAASPTPLSPRPTSPTLHPMSSPVRHHLQYPSSLNTVGRAGVIMTRRRRRWQWGRLSLVVAAPIVLLVGLLQTARQPADELLLSSEARIMQILESTPGAEEDGVSRAARQMEEGAKEPGQDVELTHRAQPVPSRRRKRHGTRDIPEKEEEEVRNKRLPPPHQQPPPQSVSNHEPRDKQQSPRGDDADDEEEEIEDSEQSENNQQQQQEPLHPPAAMPVHQSASLIQRQLQQEPLIPHYQKQHLQQQQQQQQQQQIEKEKHQLRQQPQQQHPQEAPHGAISSASSSSSSSTNTERYAYVTSVFLGTKYICGAVMLAWTLRQRREDIDLVALVAGHLAASDDEHRHALETLRRVGYRIVEAPLLLNHFEQREQQQQSHGHGDNNKKAKHHFGELERRSFLFSKLNMYALVDYTKILFIDADVFILNHGRQDKPPLSDELFEQHEAWPQPAGHFFLPNEINVGFMLARPSMKTYWDMLTRFNTIHAVKTGDQDFQNQYWNMYHQGFEEMSSLNGKYRDFNNLRFPFFKDDETTPYNRVDAPLHKGFRIYHPFGLKPWNCPRELYCETNEERGMKYIWPQVTDLWWSEFDEMAEAWPWLTEDPQSAGYCITTKIPDKWFRINQGQLEKGRKNEFAQKQQRRRHRQQQEEDYDDDQT